MTLCLPPPSGPRLCKDRYLRVAEQPSNKQHRDLWDSFTHHLQVLDTQLKDFVKELLQVRISLVFAAFGSHLA